MTPDNTRFYQSKEEAALVYQRTSVRDLSAVQWTELNELKQRGDEPSENVKNLSNIPFNAKLNLLKNTSVYPAD